MNEKDTNECWKAEKSSQHELDIKESISCYEYNSFKKNL